MNSRDACVLGLLALAYWYLDTHSTPASQYAGLEEGERFTPFPNGAAALAVEPECPRRSGHRVSLRADGAMWCRTCDEGFFPEAAEWLTVRAGAAA